MSEQREPGDPRRCPHCGEVMSGKYRCPCRSIDLEAARLRRLGYSWDQSYDAAEVIQLLSSVGVLAMPVEDLEEAWSS